MSSPLEVPEPYILINKKFAATQFCCVKKLPLDDLLPIEVLLEAKRE
jgi:hypothetical protein